MTPVGSSSCTEDLPFLDRYQMQLAGFDNRSPEREEMEGPPEKGKPYF